MATKRKKTTAKNKDAWFYPIRGSYLPCSWQGRSIYLIAIAYIVTSWYLLSITDLSYTMMTLQGLKDILLVGFILTAIAKDKS